MSPKLLKGLVWSIAFNEAEADAEVLSIVSENQLGLTDVRVAYL